VRHEEGRTGLEEAGGTPPPRFAAGTVSELPHFATQICTALPLASTFPSFGHRSPLPPGSPPAIAKLLKNLGLTSNATLAQVVPYLNSLGTVAVGQSVSGGYVVERIAIG
jgi:hypothetical protein